MKYLFLMALALGTQAALAQGSPEAGVDLERFNKLRGRQQTMQGMGRPAPALRGPATRGPEYAGSNAKGEIYVLQQDNMPMLKPWLPQQNPMPGTTGTALHKGQDEFGRMPNAMEPAPYRFRRYDSRPR